jgi:UDP-N-acetylenolpyruvoylglucosamine reductase
MFVLENVPLSGYSTMRLGGPARYLADITDKFDIPKALNWADAHKVPVVMVAVTLFGWTKGSLAWC